MNATKTPTVDHTAASGFLRLPLALFRTAVAPQIDLYCPAEDNVQPRLLASRELGITDAQIGEMAKREVSSLFVRKGDFERASANLLESLEEIVADRSYPAEQRFQVLQSTIAMEVEKSFRFTDCNRFVALADRVGTQITNLVDQGPIAPLELFAVAEHDTTTFIHVTNVAAYAVMLAQALTISDEDEQRQIAVGALLHDIGKRSIPRDVLASPSRLTIEQREVMEKHPRIGYVELCGRDDLSFGQLMMVYQHHEWVDGSGYPVGVVGDEIHPWARLLAVVDVFDAVTASRPYRTGMDLSDALELLNDGVDSQFDSEVVKCWTSLFHQPSQK